MSPDTVCECLVRAAVNHNERRLEAGARPDMLVLHYTGMADENEAFERLCGAEGGVSCHYMVFEDGRIAQMVPEALRAWHAGIASWRGHEDINSRSIGIEIANPGHQYGYRPFADEQIAAVIALCADILARNKIEPRNVVAHSDIAPSRKEDPGELFPWAGLAQSGIGHWVEPEPISSGRFFAAGDSGQPVEALQLMLAGYGYGVEATGIFDEATHGVVAAFQRHFRPALVDGVADVSTITTLHRLLKALPGA